MLQSIFTTQVKERVRRKKKKKCHEKFASSGFEPGPSENIWSKKNTSTHWTTSVSADNPSLKEVYIPSLWWLTVFDVKLIEARRKAHNKPINTLSGLVHAGERLRNLWTIDRAATYWTVWPYDSFPARKVSFHRSGKTLTQHCLSLFPLF